jgi:NAD(P)-dependent dehydrogenase (short-subunit alcohol dehydrogenase family)
MNLQGKVAIVTGGGSGLGRASAEALVAKGAFVGVLDVNEANGQAVAKGLGDKAIFCRADVSDTSSVEAALGAVMTKFGALHVCINCAGIGNPGKTYGSKGPLPLDEFRKIIEVNLIGTFNVIRLAAAEMAKNAPDPATEERGVIINTSSGAAYAGQMGQAAYTASKAGVAAMGLPIARDLSRLGIRINAIAPGLFETGMTAPIPPNIKQGLVGAIEFPKRLGEPAEFAAMAVAIIEIPYLNGETIRIDAASRPPAR